jgi:hypothetical protein
MDLEEQIKEILIHYTIKSYREVTTMITIRDIEILTKKIMEKIEEVNNGKNKSEV